jgi:hypothetical protein
MHTSHLQKNLPEASVDPYIPPCINFRPAPLTAALLTVFKGLGLVGDYFLSDALPSIP